MTDKQVQKAASGSMAIQAQGDVTINQGVSAQQMMEIMDAISARVEKFSLDARTLVEDRLDQFKESLILEFAKDSGARSEAFADPDFQHALFGAQTAYARTNDVDLQAVLVDLVVQRSKQDKRSRLTLTLNDAISKAASFTNEEFSILAIAFLMQRVQNNGIANLQGVAKFYADCLKPLLDTVPAEEGAYSYLESHGCLLMDANIISRPGMLDILLQRYPGCVTKGIPLEELQGLVPQEQLNRLYVLVTDSPFGASLKVLVPGSKETLAPMGGMLGIQHDFADKYVEKAKANLPTDKELLAKLVEYEPSLENAAQVYDSSPMRNSRLTSIGVALAHAYLTRTISLKADLAIWIK
ncbi:hypothetical protein CN198_19015 [Sinorhizobium meliloti]|uniref:LPO_1073/Vpar_1526 family protein n=1 Tax=Rhizobium meliloti TaxID=382 RepID=UPI000FDCB335|nr:LPO_1073/Vpar_1526 family protein [Sinorhizobium meliloti]MDW9500280.1 hypothetical protein [Sinorhizobium meliloti]MDX0026903.1 hypothetical protein [Sinorhizobium meliloti]MDX0070393.1 hypothetical protein [Sinorhizobium meliloti]RVH66494.1 hypothetical protein CN198_19015 [Sinorhizobium meliloti]RVK64535.1 hypothetical protein CN159_23895 [Sinorhizobium meliloti]